MKYRGITIGQPEKFEYVKGTSLTNAICLLYNGHLNLGKKYEDSFNEFQAYKTNTEQETWKKYEKELTIINTHFNIEKIYADIKQEEQTQIIRLAKKDAKHEARKRHIEIVKRKGINLESYLEQEPTDSWFEFGKEIKDECTQKTAIEYYDELQQQKGVLIYFNKKLDQQIIIPNANSNTEHNQKIIKPMTLITRKYVTAIQPLGPLEQKKLEKLVKLYTPTTTQIIKEYIRQNIL